LIIQWENCRGEDRLTNYPKQLTLSINLLTLLKKVNRISRVRISIFIRSFLGSYSAKSIE